MSGDALPHDFRHGSRPANDAKINATDIQYVTVPHYRQHTLKRKQ
jgi:hypothetical protein